MKHPLLPRLAALALAGILAGCGGRKDDTPDPAALAAAFEETAPEVPEPASPETAAAPAPPDEGPPVQQLVSQAVLAIEKDEVTEAMLLLQTLRANPRLSPQQLTAVQDTMAGLMQQLARRADAGDARARQAMELINQRTRW
ncbi:MAG TPA: hypothetical protein PKE47_13550 [Verrucomicrobiota bacterium]|nr:hypothetical protein [Verrucomicrobiota bacterium]